MDKRILLLFAGALLACGCLAPQQEPQRVNNSVVNVTQNATDAMNITPAKENIYPPGSYENIGLYQLMDSPTGMECNYSLLEPEGNYSVRVWAANGMARVFISANGTANATYLAGANSTYIRVDSALVPQQYLACTWVHIKERVPLPDALFSTDSVRSCGIGGFESRDLMLFGNVCEE
jgi:hypothetical protein